MIIVAIQKSMLETLFGCSLGSPCRASNSIKGQLKQVAVVSASRAHTVKHLCRIWVRPIRGQWGDASCVWRGWHPGFWIQETLNITSTVHATTRLCIRAIRQRSGKLDDAFHLYLFFHQVAISFNPF